YGLLKLKSEPPMTRFMCNQMGKNHYFSHARAKNDFGYEAQVSVEEGLRRYFLSVR
ncbi:MAG: hypothetical protein JNM93_08065, partial [Bacteriovoracaceae bacterium]|nr:hypothetical protein [Bacteriovoracaceae bacterium]